MATEDEDYRSFEASQPMMMGTAVALSYGVPRSTHWPRVEKEHLAQHQNCLVCGKGVKDGVKVNVHHGFPFHFVVAVGRPDLELDERNLHTLCVEHEEEHHLLVGHLGSFESYNPYLKEDLRRYQGMAANDIRADPKYQQKVVGRPKSLGLMSSAERNALKHLLDTVFPKVA